MGSLQEIRSIATKSVATSIFRGNIFQFYHELSGRGSRTPIFPRLFLVAINFHFVAVEDSYCNKMYRGWNTIAILRQLSSVARGNHSVALGLGVTTKKYDFLPQLCPAAITIVYCDNLGRMVIGLPYCNNQLLLRK